MKLLKNYLSIKIKFLKQSLKKIMAIQNTN
jgi:hypothetical protein